MHDVPEDVEGSRPWLEGLRALNSVIAATGAPLAGNLFYDHHQESYVDQAPNPILRLKRDRFRAALERRTRLLEIGVNGGHSAYLALTANSELEFHGVDICEHPYVRPAASWLSARFPGRFFLHEGDSRKVLPMLQKRGLRYDAFHVDGAKHTYLEDILNSQRMVLARRAIVIVDDTQQAHVTEVWQRCVRQRRILPLTHFPEMPETLTYRNQIGLLEAEPGWRVPLSRLSLFLVAPTERANALTRRVRTAAGIRIRGLRT